MNLISDGAIQVTIAFNEDDLDIIKAQVEDILQSSRKPLNKEEVEKFMASLKEAMVEGLTSAAVWLAKLASDDAPIETGLLRASGSVWLNNNRIYITGGGTHPSHVDTGELEAIIIFNTPYAFIQDTEEDYEHPRGGRAGYLTRNLTENQTLLEEMMIAPVKKALQ